MPKSRAKKKTKLATAEMSTAEAAVATLIAHGLDTIYALPGVHNDHLFDAFQRAGDSVLLLGAGGSGASIGGEADALAGSEYLELAHDRVAGRPRIDLELERRLQQVCLQAARAGLLASAHDCAEGGLAVALAECCLLGDLGFDGAALSVSGRRDAALFGEVQSRIVVSVRPEAEVPLLALAKAGGVPVLRLGRVAADRFTLADLIDLSLADLRERYEGALPAALGAVTGV